MKHSRTALLIGGACALALAVAVVAADQRAPISPQAHEQSEASSAGIEATPQPSSISNASQPMRSGAASAALPPGMTPPGVLEDPAAGLDRSAPPSDFPALGEPSIAIQESGLEIDRSSPHALLASLLRARELGDAAACARVSLDYQRFPQLGRLDLAWARRSFLSPSGGLIWDRVAAAMLAERGECIVQGDSAHLLIDFGGALGEWACWFEHDAAGWRLLTDRAPAQALTPRDRGESFDGGAE